MAGPRGDEKGSAMLMVVSFLLALSVLSAVWMAAAHADALVTLRRKAERESFYAAEAVLEAALADLSDPERSPVAREELLGSPPSLAPKIREGTLEGWDYRWRVSLLDDEGNADGRDDTPFVLFDRAFGYRESPYPAAGFPVLQISVSVCRGDVRRGLAAEAAPLSLSLQVPAGWTSAGALTLQGPFLVSGRNHDREGGAVGDPDGSLPALVAGGEVTLLQDAAVVASGGRAIVQDGTRAFADSPGAVLGIEGGARRLAAPPDDTGGAERLSGVSYFTSDWSGRLEGHGVLVVHNPRFLPRSYEASRLALEEGIFTEEYDPLYSHLDTRNQPASLEVVRGGLFHGLVVADSFGPVYDDTRILGAVVTLGASPALARAYGSAEVLYSRDALRDAELGPVTEKLAFKALPWDSLTSDRRCD